MTSLWAKADQYLIDELMTELGPDGLYADLTLTKVFFDDFLTLERAVVADEFPIILLRSLDNDVAVAEHGLLPSTGKLPLNHEYEYRIISLVQADGRSDCRIAGQEMRRRILVFLAKRVAFGGLAGDDGERVRGIVFKKCTLDMWSRSSNDDATWYGIVEVNFVIESKG